MNRPFPQDRLLELQSLVASRNVIEAIKLYRECTGAGLAEAKEAVERIAAGCPPPAMPEHALAPGQQTQLHDLLFRNEKIAAIKEYRDITRSGLAEAKQAVERMEAELRAREPHKFMAPARKAGCFGLWLALTTLGLSTLACAVVWWRGN